MVVGSVTGTSVVVSVGRSGTVRVVSVAGTIAVVASVTWLVCRPREPWRSNLRRDLVETAATEGEPPAERPALDALSWVATPTVGDLYTILALGTVTPPHEMPPVVPGPADGGEAR